MATRKSGSLVKATRRRTRQRRHYEGPREWLFPMLEEAYSKLRPRAEAEAEEAMQDLEPPPRRKASRAIAKEETGIRHERDTRRNSAGRSPNVALGGRTARI